MVFGLDWDMRVMLLITGIAWVHRSASWLTCSEHARGEPFSLHERWRFGGSYRDVRLRIQGAGEGVEFFLRFVFGVAVPLLEYPREFVALAGDCGQVVVAELAPLLLDLALELLPVALDLIPVHDF